MDQCCYNYNWWTTINSISTWSTVFQTYRSTLEGDQPSCRSTLEEDQPSCRSTLEGDQQTTLRHRHYCHHDTADHYNGRERTGSLDSLPLTEASSSFHRTSSWDFSEEETDQEVVRGYKLLVSGGPGVINCLLVKKVNGFT